MENIKEIKKKVDLINSIDFFHRRINMSKTDVDAIIAHYENEKPFLYKIKNCSRSKAYSIKREIDKKLNIHDKFCELKYDSDTKIAIFDIVN